ncbi:hypothetical protein AL540_020930 [Vibrio harveyi]|nr:hypothetical protein AL540_020930 [Vibrio harveyi]
MRKQDKVSGQKSGLKVRALITEQSVSIQRKKRPQGGAFGQKVSNSLQRKLRVTAKWLVALTRFILECRGYARFVCAVFLA